LGTKKGGHGVAKTASNILSWDPEKETYFLTGQEKTPPADFFEQEANWFGWLESHKSFAFRGKSGRLSLQKETRPSSQKAYWYAYQRQGKRIVKQYLGGSPDMTLERLESAARNLTAKAQGTGIEAEDLAAKPRSLIPTNQLENITASTSLAVSSDFGGSDSQVLPSFEPVLEPKLRLPRLHSSLIPRQRLLDRLDEGLEHKLTLVSAPAGFGKTTLVRQWLADRFEFYPTAHSFVPKIAWVSLDTGDNDPVRFWRYIIMACHAGGLSADQTALEQLNTPSQPPYHPVSLQVVLITFLNELNHSDRPGPNILVLEDYHVLTSAQLHESLVFFVENLPTNLHLIIITRHDPPLPLARLRGQNELNELHAADLRFSAEETWDFLQKNSTYNFSEETVRQLDRHLEGWGTGLRLLTLALQSFQGQSQIEKFFETFAGNHRSIQEYFATEVLNVLPDKVQVFILQTSVLERLTPALCTALTGEPASESEKVLETLAKGNLFLEPLSGSGEWYRYHTLFAEAMQPELRRRYGGASVAELYNRASRWFEQNGHFPDAVEMALHAQDFEEAARIIEKIIGEDHYLGMQFFQEMNEFYTISRWLKLIPNPVIRRHPSLCLNYAQAIFFKALIEQSMLTQVAQAQVIEALSWAEEGWHQANARRGQIYAFRALLSNMDGQIDEALKWAGKSLELLPDGEHHWRGMVLNVFGSYELYNGNIDQAKRYLNEARYNSDALGNRNFTRANMGLLAYTYLEQGELNQANEYFSLVLAEAREINDQDDITHSQLGLAWLSYEWNNLEAAWQQSQEVLDINLKISGNSDLAEAHLIQARILHVRGQLDQAQQRLSSLLIQVQHPVSVIDYQQYRAVRLAQTQFYQQDGNLAGFERWVNSHNFADPVGIGKEFRLFLVQRIGERLLLARWMIGRGEWEEALLLLEPLLAEVQSSGRFRFAMKIRLNMALALAAGKRLQEARQLVQAVLSQAYIEGYMRLFLDEGEPMANLLRATPLPTGSKVLSQYRQKILQSFEQTGSPALANIGGEALSQQEQRVLALLGAGLSYSDIARELVVSVNTIKTQVKSIYQKLNINNRMQAQTVARQLKSP
jgi:LuxR family maltose regulon positive regulatory protein